MQRFRSLVFINDQGAQVRKPKSCNRIIRTPSKSKRNFRDRRLINSKQSSPENIQTICLGRVKVLFSSGSGVNPGTKLAEQIYLPD